MRSTLYLCICILLYINICVCSTNKLNIRGISKKDEELYRSSDLNTFICDDNIKLSYNRINDNYCDCMDGKDEPATNACENSRFFCRNKGYVSKYITSSMVNDGICDCCDGSDEYDNNIKCENTCDELGKDARLEKEAMIKALKVGINIKSTWINEANVFLQQYEKKKSENEEKLTEQLSLVEDLRVKKEKLEKEEKEENERLKAEYNIKYGLNKNENEEEENKNQIKNNENDVLESNDKTEEKQENVEEVENFPYPKEYAAPSDTNNEGNQEENENEENFPYPKEYAAPSTTTSDNNNDNNNIDEKNSGNTESNEDNDSLTDAIKKDDIPAYNEYHSEDAETIRKEFNEATRKRDELQKEVNDAKKVLELDFGENNVFTALHGACYELRDKQYTYIMCPFDKAEQKEHSSTSIGKWDKYDKESETFHFTGGAKCWNGPQRSCQVRLKCGGENKLISVEEPSKCVYEMVFETPAACNQEHLDALLLNLMDEGNEEEEEGY